MQWLIEEDFLDSSQKIPLLQNFKKTFRRDQNLRNMQNC